MKMSQMHFRHYLNKSPISSVCELARHTQLHRNTINHYLAGSSVYQHGFLKVCESLQVLPSDLITPPPHKNIITSEIAKIVDEMHAQFPQISFLLFGSRARGLYKKFSDWDIGFFSLTPIPHQTHLNLLKLKDDLAEELIEEIDLVNLNEASIDFINDNKKDFHFLTGSLTAYQKLTKGANQ